jgi:hypothetical protein
MKKIFAILMLIPFVGIAQQSPPAAQGVLDINNVATTVGPAAMCWDLNSAKYEVPKGGGVNSIFAHDLWVGGIDDNGQLRLATQQFRQNGNDYWSGPVSDSTYHNDVDMAGWDRVWKIDKTEIDDHIVNYSSGSYTMPDAIEHWPAHGDVSKGQAPNLAPFVDVDNDGQYIPLNGDYPEIKGDQAVYFIRNDVGNVHTESGGEQIGLEIHMMFYAYRCDDIPELNHTVFVKTTLFNRGSYNLNNTYIGTWVDMDLGYYLDDYVACNVPLNLGYTYNGDNDDEGSSGYGVNPPAQGLVYLNNSMDKFIYIRNDNTIIGNPNVPQHYYNYLQGVWIDDSVMTYGGNGHGGSLADTCSYMFPGDTDPNFTTPWTEVTAGNVPADRRFLQSHGPFDFDTNTSYTLEYAFVFAWDSTNTNGGSIPLLFNYTQNIQDFYDGVLAMPCSNVTLVNELSNLAKGKLLKIIDVLGRETEPKKNTPLFYLYDDGEVEKRIIVE